MAEQLDEFATSDSLDDDHPSLTREEVEATLVRINNPLKIANASLLEPGTRPSSGNCFDLQSISSQFES